MRPPIAALRACFNESLPSVAETSVRSSGTKFTGSAPVCSTSARFFASCRLAMPVICAPVPVGLIPFGRLL